MLKAWSVNEKRSEILKSIIMSTLEKAGKPNQGEMRCLTPHDA